MKKIYKQLVGMLFIVCMGVSFAGTSAYAEGYIKRGHVTDHFKTVIDRSPYQVEVCQKVTTQGGDPTTGAIIGGIIGGAIGNQMDGKNAGEVGAVLGAIIGIENEKKKGTSKTYNHCYLETRYNETERTVYSHSVLDFEFEGRMYSVSFVKTNHYGN